jgi:DNA-directed RNA polymerase specialized sigma24 family protein
MQWFSPAAEEAISVAWEEMTGEQHAARLAALSECVAALPEDGREAITQFYTARQRVAAIARGMGRSAEAVYQLLTRTRARLAACVQRRLARGAEAPDN